MIVDLIQLKTIGKRNRTKQYGSEQDDYDPTAGPRNEPWAHAGIPRRSASARDGCDRRGLGTGLLACGLCPCPREVAPMRFFNTEGPARALP